MAAAVSGVAWIAAYHTAVTATALLNKTVPRSRVLRFSQSCSSVALIEPVSCDPLLRPPQASIVPKHRSTHKQSEFLGPRIPDSSTRARAPASSEAMAGEAAKRASASLPAPEGYRANVGICLVNQDNKVFVASRIDKPGAWQMPQGGIDSGEDPAAAARRELREETGVTSADLVAEAPDWLCYDFPPDVRAKLTIAWGKEWQGQAQKWFLFRYTGKDESEIDLLGDGSERPEFDAWKWLDVPSVVDAAVEFKRPVYEAAFRSFEPHLR